MRKSNNSKRRNRKYRNIRKKLVRGKTLGKKEESYMGKHFRKYIKGYEKESFLAPLLMLVEVGLEVSIPFFMTYIIDRGVKQSNQGYIWRTGGMLVVFAILSLVCGALSGRFAALASTGLAKNLRKGMYDNIQNFSFSNIDRFSPASLVTRMTTDVTNVQNAYQMVIRTMVRSLFMQVCCLVIVFMTNVKIALIFAIAIPVLAVGIVFIVLKAHPLFEKVFRTYDELNQVVQENVRGIREVKSFVREDHENTKFQKISTKVFKNFIKAEKIVVFNSPMMQIVMYTCMILIYWFGAKYMVAGSLTSGEFMRLITYVLQSLFSLMIMSMVLVMIVISQASIERIVEVLDEESDLKSKENAVMTVADGSIDFDHVSFSYYEGMNKMTLQDINFSVKSGETLGVIGGTGSAKSTLAQLIPRLYDVSEGSLRVGGLDVRDYDLESLREDVAMVLQKNILFSGTIKENLRWGNKDATDEEMIHACRLAQADSFIQEFSKGYDTYIEQGGSNVSGGQRQRLCIARALLKKPKILILDDSTSAVDTKTDAMLQEAFRQEIPGTTKVIIAQRISSVESADKIVVLDKGMVHGIGTHEELLKTDYIYQEVYETQKKGGEEHDA